MKNNTINLEDLVGKTYELKYSSEVYHVTFQSDSELFWELKDGEIEGPSSGTDSYIKSELYPGVHFISWTEETGLVLCNVIDFNTMKFTTHGTYEGQMSVNPGILRRV